MLFQYPGEWGGKQWGKQVKQGGEGNILVGLSVWCGQGGGRWWRVLNSKWRGRDVVAVIPVVSGRGTCFISKCKL